MDLRTLRRTEPNFGKVRCRKPAEADCDEESPSQSLVTIPYRRGPSYQYDWVVVVIISDLECEVTAHSPLLRLRKRQVL